MKLTFDILNILLIFYAFVLLSHGLPLHYQLLQAQKYQESLKRKCSYTQLQICRGGIVYSICYIIGNIRWISKGYDADIDSLDTFTWIIIDFTIMMTLSKILELGKETIARSRERREKKTNG